MPDSLNVLIDRAPATATQAGPLAGWTLAVKSNIAVRGLPWTAGIGAFAQRIAAEDAPAVALARAAGCSVIGTVNMDEAALGAVSDNPHFGRTQNPRRPGHTPGGSSGGSAAAVAAGIARVALGTDTMGSCRIPAAYCGVVGFKPSQGRVSLRGVEPLAARLDQVGVLAGTVEDARTLFQAIGRFDPACARSRDLGPLRGLRQRSPADIRLAVLDAAGLAHCTAAVRDSYRLALARLRDAGVECIPRVTDLGMLRAARRAGLLICEAELALSLEAPLREGGDGVSAYLRRLIDFAQKRSAVDLARAHALIDATLVHQRTLLERVDAVFWPTAPQAAFMFGTPIPDNQADFSCLANFTGAPAVSLPLPATDLPIGGQLLAEHGADSPLLDLAATLETHFTPGTPP
jgi:aspartyl-tRNA(Asn)/glutamyl-tRNA(Gln) amidotransferase subunit A